MMHQNEVEILLPFSEEEIGKDMYTSNLISRCAAEGLITADKFQMIISDLNATFTEISRQFIGRSSNCISNAQAEQLYSSILYWADVELLSLGSLVKAVQTLRNQPMSAILHSGMERIQRLHEENKQLFMLVLEQQLQVTNEEYQNVCTKAYRSYLQNYSARFDARNMMMFLDYPLLNADYLSDVPEGILYVNKYYRMLSVENTFCHMFDQEKLDRLIKKASVTNGFSLYNVTAVVCAQCFANLLLGKNEMSISLAAKDIPEVTEKCRLFTEESLTSELLKTLPALREWFPSDTCYHYIVSYIPHFVHTACFFAGTQAGLKKQLYALR